MIIILEGADLTGKTTLADHLSAHLNMPIVRPWIHLAYPKPSVISVARTLHHLFCHIHPDVIYDRFFFSEYVYAQVMGREHEYVSDLIREWASVLGMYLVCLTASDETLESRYAARDGDWYVSLPQIRAIKDAYAELLAILPTTIPTLSLDTSQLSPDAAADEVISWLHAQAIH
jgi:thymidylate kinase